jgi:glycosyltransferase involved in cell wall biosynthesis
MKKIIRITTVPISLRTLLKGQLKFMSQHYEVIGVTSSGKEVNDVINHEGIRVIEVELSRSITPIKDLKSLYKVFKTLKREKPFIVHSHTPKAGTIGMIAAKLAGVPHRLHTIAGLPLLEAKGAKRILLDLVEKITYSSATIIYPNSKGLRDIIIENKYTKPSKLKVIANGSSNGIDTNHFSIDQLDQTYLIKLKKELQIEKDDFVFIFVGRLVTDKGINELVSAFKKIQEVNVKLLLVGTFEDELDPLKEETKKELESNQNIITVSWKNDVRPYFAISNVLVFPSYREGFPNVVMQAGALGLPSIVTDINGCNEIIENKKNGVIIQPKNSNKLLEAMKIMLTDQVFTQKMAAASRAIICSNYKREVVWESLLKEYKSLENE